MSKTRHDAFVRSFAVTFHSAQTFSYTVDGWDQLVYAVKGVVTVHVARDSWVLPARRALWVPSGVDARIAIPGPVSLRSLYFQRGIVRGFGRKCRAVNVSPLLQELILETVKLQVLRRSRVEERRLAGVLADRLRAVPMVPLQLPMPNDPRARRAAETMLEDPGSHGMTEVARRSGASVRTLERLFRAETGMPLGSWRRRMRMLESLRILAAGEPVTVAALKTGYESTSAFVSMFRRELGVTPGRYFSQSGSGA